VDDEFGEVARVEGLRLGTSRSRLSTYLSGKVTPSAGLLVRMERLVERVNADVRAR
jgi:transcriptional regulator with XRE-family HTH domain